MSDIEPVPLPEDEPLRAAEVGEVLRYWLAALRFEEALTSRPRAHKLDPRRPPVVDLRDPRGGQPYFKLRGDEEGQALLLRRASSLVLDLDAERTAFFLRWLRLAYIRMGSAFPGWDGDPGAAVVGWPVVFFPKTEELAGLLRMRATVAFYGADGRRFEPPDPGARRAGRVPAAPVQVRVARVDDEEEGLLPFSLDEQLLVRTLGVSEEELADLHAALKGCAALSPAMMVATVCALLEAREGWAAAVEAPADEAGLFERLVAAVRGRLEQGRGLPQVYGVGLVHDGDQVFATRHLQRELTQLVERRVGVPPWGQQSPLWGYLSGKAPVAGWAPLRGLRAPRPLTADQRAVAERFLASPLTAAQGPPGTGKTELLLNLAAGALVERVSALADGQPMPRELLLVASTNNRAVDQVLDPLAEGDEPPIALRVGNMQVLAAGTVDLLMRALGWIERRPERPHGEVQGALEAALAEFRRLRAVVDAADAPRVAGRELVRRRARVVDRIAAREAALSRWAAEADGPPAPAGVAEELDRRLRAMDGLLDRVRKLIDRGGPELLTRVMTVWQSQAGRVLKRLEGALAKLDPPLVVAVSLPPAVAAGAEEAAHVEAWDDAVEAAAEALAGVRRRLEARREAAACRDALALLRDELVLLPEAGEAGAPADAEVQFGLFVAARRVRLCWMELHRDALRAALRATIEAVSERRTLRRLVEDEPNTADWILRLFPVWGSTLLSLGNVLPALPRSGLRVVIDEAGQCHPAYAVSGLMRAEQALLIGDVHQLEPVIQLGPEDEARIRGAAGVRIEKGRLMPYRVMTHLPNSAQALADRAVGERPTLREHFRCQAPIIALSDALCGYGLVVRTPAPVGRAPLPGPVLLSAVAGAQVRVRGSWHNPEELARVMSILGALARVGVTWGEVAVITPYVGQLEALRDATRRARIPLEGGGEGAELDLFGGAGLALGTVHRFQGGERRVVVFSTVVTRSRSLQFLNGRVNLVNVAVSRAREHLVVVGDPVTLRGGPYSRLLVERAMPLPAAW
ncbi:MAG: ATP-binding domain-containing protein [Myxococcales bacterium]|nr:ATP-binding domain-containing protein [Myxococcales bacterium]